MEASEERRRVGLCVTCAHVRVIVSNRGSRFYQCRRGLTDAGFRKYPLLPVWRCRGFEEGYEESARPGRSEEQA